MTTKTHGARAILPRVFGWIVLSAIVAFLANAILAFWFDLPGPTAITSGGGIAPGFQLALYPLLAALAIVSVLRTPDTDLRTDGARVNAINTFLIRAAFWVVLLVGLGDAVVSFLRVNGMLADVIGADLAGDLGRAEFRGLYMHPPWVVIGTAIAALTRSLGFMWLSLLVVVEPPRVCRRASN